MTSWASKSIPVPESIRESNDMFKGICAVFAAAAASSAVFVVDISMDTES